MKHEPASAPANQSDTAPLRSDNVLSAASPIGRRLKHDMDRLFGRGELRVLARGGDERDRSYSLNRSRAVRSTPSGRACRILNQSIADCLDMQSQSRQAAWMLAGPGHRSERMLLAKAVALIEQQVDQLGRRIVELGGAVEGSVRQVAARAGLNEHPAAADDVAAHIESVVLAAISSSARPYRLTRSLLPRVVWHRRTDQPGFSRLPASVPSGVHALHGGHT